MEYRGQFWGSLEQGLRGLWHVRTTSYVGTGDFQLWPCSERLTRQLTEPQLKQFCTFDADGRLLRTHKTISEAVTFAGGFLPPPPSYEEAIRFVAATPPAYYTIVCPPAMLAPARAE